MVYNTSQTAKTKGAKPKFSTDEKLDGVALDYAGEFQYPGHIVSADLTDDC